MHVHNEISFPQAKLDREINVRFLLNEHDNSVHIVLLNLKETKKFYRKKKKDIGERVHETVTLLCKL